MKAIEQRAIEYAKGRWDELTAKEAYIAGAKEQKAIDDAEKHYKQGYYDAVERACDWLHLNLPNIEYTIKEPKPLRVSRGLLIDELKKAMDK